MKLVVSPSINGSATPYEWVVTPEGRPGDVWAIFTKEEEAKFYASARNARQLPGETFTLTSES